MLFLTATLVVTARPVLHDLNVDVVLTAKGHARITETRQMTIDDEGTECYIVMENLKGMSRVASLRVSDETGTVYDFEPGDWDTDRSRAAKANRCGIHRTDNGCELCWGIGASGERIYKVEYVVTNVLKGYDDADGFNFMFVSQGMRQKPQHAKVTIRREDGKPITDEVADIWGFRHYGNIHFAGGTIVDETTEPFRDESAMIIVCRFNKGEFTPEDTVADSFESVIEEAKKGSDYDDNPDDEDDNMLLALLGTVGFGAGYVAWRKYKQKKLRKSLLGDEKLLPWYRDTPVNGELLKANAIMKALYGGITSGSGNLMSALILRLIYQKVITITMAPYGRNNEPRKMLSIKKPGAGKYDYNSQDERLRHEVHQLLYDAAGDDHILQPKELKRYIQKNAEDLQPLVRLLDTSIPSKDIVGEDARAVVGLKKFLKEFTLTNERHVEEVSLWKEYLVFATLFGIGDQVRKDMAQMCPEYMEMDNVAKAMMNGTDEGMLFNSLMLTSASTSSIVSQSMRSKGSGGSTSFGGGGGFSGGGSGGGVR